MRNQRGTVWLSLSLGAALGGACFLGLGLQLSRVERRADRLAETGQAVLRLLGRYGQAMSDRSLDGARACFRAPGSPDSSIFGGLRRHVPEKDGVEILTWWAPRAGEVPAERQLEELFRGISQVETSRFKLRTVEQDRSTAQVVATSLLWVRGLDDAGRPFESHARYRLWLDEIDGELTIARQHLLEGETVRGPRDGFRDVTESAGVGFYGRHNPDWADPDSATFPKMYEVIRYVPGGVSAGDFDGDGWEDLFFGDGVSSRLYANQRDGTFRDVTREAGLPPDLGGVHVGLFADFDNDGDQDLFVAGMTRPNRLFENLGSGTFRDVSAAAGIDYPLVVAATAADYDNDGRLDLYLGRYLDPARDVPATPFYSRRGPGNVLLGNLGGLRFEDRTARAGVADGGHTLAVTSTDLDRDGWQDIYVGNDFGRNALFRNNGDGTFTDVAPAAGALDIGYSMSASSGDLDNDGSFDLYVAGVHSGQRWYGQSAAGASYVLRSFRQGPLREMLPLYLEVLVLTRSAFLGLADRIVRGNSLLLRRGARFADVSEECGANPPGWYWGTAIFDFDNDGWKDVYLGSGWISAPGLDDL